MRNKDWQEAILELTAFLDEWWYLPDITFPKSHSEIHNCVCWKCTFFSTYNLINGVPVHSCLELCSWREEKQGGEMLLTQKSITDKSELENNLFCHTVRGSDCRVCLFIFIDQHKSHFKIASPRTTLIPQRWTSQFLFHWVPLSWKRESLKAELYSLSPAPPPCSRSSSHTCFPSAPAFPTEVLVLTRNKGSHAKISRHGHSSVGTNKALTSIINCPSLFLWSSEMPGVSRHSQPWALLCPATSCRA